MNPYLFTNPSIGTAYQNDPRTAYAQALMQQGGSTAPVLSWGEGLARALGGALGGLQAGQVRQGYQGQDQQYQQGLTAALQGKDVLESLQNSGQPQLQQLALETRVKQALEKPAKDGLVKIYDPTTKTERYVPESQAAGMQADGPQGPKVGDTRQYQIGGNKVTDQWDGEKWVKLGSGPAWDPNGNQGNAYFGTPVPMVGPDGKPAVGMLGKDGQLHVAAPNTPGFSPAPGVQYLNTGTGFVPAPKQAGQDVSAAPSPAINVQGAQAQQTRGTAQGTAAVNLPGVTDSANNALAEIDRIKTDPYLGEATGWSGIVLNRLPGTGAKALSLKVDQLKGGAFLQAYQTLKGAGAITEVEGQKATAALARLDTSQSKEDFQAALDDYADIIRQGVARLQNMSQGTFAPAGPQSPNQIPPAAKPLPTPGVTEDGFQFKGGNPGDPANWVKVAPKVAP